MTEREKSENIMTTAKRFFFLISVLAVSLATPAAGYNDEVTHPQLTIVATEKSSLYTDGTIMFNLGLLPADKQYFLYGARAGHTRYGTAVYPLSSFVGEGAFDEDIGRRSLNHFFDPFFNRPLDFPGSSFFNTRRSWEWALEEFGANIPEQNRSEWDARGYLRRSLTFNDGAPADSDYARNVAMAEMFLSLGHVLHHLQDMTQPQHVRNDLHWDEYPYWFNPEYDPSRYEAYTAERGPFVQNFAEVAAPNFPGPLEFKRPRDFWVNSAGSGLAEFTNRHFVSKDTNFSISKGIARSGEYPLPLPGTPTNYTIESLYVASGVPVPAEIQTICGSPSVNCTMTMYPTPLSSKASTLSIFDQDLRKNGITIKYSFPFFETERLFALNRFNFDAAHEILIGKAVSYSAGFLNYFFRGRFEVMAPATGPFAVVDHSENKGFTKVRARVMNASGVELAPGQFRAIAKFHRNLCYTPDLNGEFTLDSSGQLVINCNEYRSEEAQLRMTAEETQGFLVGETKDMTFTFSDPIPLDATDLILQVLYRGTVGDEVDGFALGAADISEPTYFTVMNATDVFELNGQAFYDYNEIIAKIGQFPYSIIDLSNPKDGNFSVPPDVEVRGGDVRYEIKLNGQKVGDVPALPEGRFARIAALISTGGADFTLTAIGNGFNSISNYQMGAKIFQYDPQFNALVVSPVDKLRSQTMQFNSVSYYHYYPTFGTPLSKMPASNRADADVLIPVQMDASTLQSRQLLSLSTHATSENPESPRGNRQQEAKGAKPMKAPTRQK